MRLSGLGMQAGSAVAWPVAKLAVDGTEIVRDDPELAEGKDPFILQGGREGEIKRARKLGAKVGRTRGGERGSEVWSWRVGWGAQMGK